MNWFANLTVAGVLLMTALPVSGQTCTPLQVVGGQEVEVEKAVSAPGLGFTRSNWHTDFIVPTPARFNRYVAAILPQASGNYQVQMTLKYADKTVETVYSQVVGLAAGEYFLLPFVPRSTKPLQQINLLIGGVSAIGNYYTAGVSGCNQ